MRHKPHKPQGIPARRGRPDVHLPSSGLPKSARKIREFAAGEEQERPTPEAEGNSEFAGARSRMAPINHAGPLPWVQLRNVVYGTSVFRKMVGRMAAGIKAGDLVSVYDRDATPFGTALYNSQASIALRMVDFGPAWTDESFLEQRIAQAATFRREVLKLDDATNAYRIAHAEGDGLPGLIIDRLGDAAVVELFSLAMHRRRERIEKTLREVLPIQRVVFRADAGVQAAEGFFIPAPRFAAGDGAKDLVTENGLRFHVDLAGGHKTGFFCDQRENRQRILGFTNGAQVADLCCYSGGFGIYAAAKGSAAHVTAVDLDEKAVELARRNANLNQIPASRYQTVHADSFPYIRQMRQNGRLYDVVILDPPKLIPQRGDFAEGRQAYFDLNKLAMGIVKPGGVLVTCSCSGLLDIAEFLNLMKGASRSAARRIQIFQITGPGPDHPVMTDFLEGLYLKCLWCRVW